MLALCYVVELAGVEPIKNIYKSSLYGYLVFSDI